ncbi:hypothetical protein BDQ12DRAFT_132552 [Crucibulum laeve]|uniref:Uncharacterized protein n=1 Tax=Crucibulum laeve TaxID=68775 RepID=A0A5C3M0V7_9AGAR|nr:hypothetical protein BDQ12DRAFT_132552 [Crucibulum laeve]
MCLGQNSAHHAVHYLNAQIGALWENATECVKKSGQGLKPLDRVRYDFALAEFHVGTRQRSKFNSKDDMMFSAVFDKPRLEFICNHEAVLYVKIKEGHFNRDFAKTDSSAFVPNSSRNVKLHDMEVAFRVEFNLNGIRGHTSNIGNGTHIIQLLVLDLQSAKLASKVNVSGGREALAFYLQRYLSFLHIAGHHVLFSLPDFDDDRLDVVIDYSLETHRIRNLDVEQNEIYGVSLDEINRSLSSKWLKAIMDAADGGDRSSICLAEYRSNWTNVGHHSDVQFHVKFGAPTLKALCKREAILYFKVDELLVYDGHDFTKTPKHTYSGWDIAVVVDLIKEVEGLINRVKIDMSTFRFCEHLSLFTGFDASIDFASSLKATFVEFIDYYGTVLEHAHFHVIHAIDNTPVDISDSSSDSDSEDEGGRSPRGPRAEWELIPGKPKAGVTDIIKKTRTFGYDFVQVISVQSIVEHFKTLWHLSRDSKDEHTKCLTKWSYGEDFTSTFGALKLRYLSNDKAIIWIQLDDGVLKPLKSTKTYNFMDWSIAFEVDFKLISQKDVASSSKSWFTRFTESFAWKSHGNHEDRELKHLCLDFSSAKFVYELSKFEGLHLAERSAVERVRGAVHFLKAHYLSELTLHGHHILHSMPIWKSSPPAMGVTGLTFQIYSKNTYDRSNCTRSQSSEAVLVLLGMTGFRPLPKGRLEYSTEWLTKVKNGVSHGTVCISRKVFLEERLLRLLAHVNATTTIVPVFPGVVEDGACVPLFTGLDGGEWGMSLTTWAARNLKRPRACKWELNAGSESDYKWDHTDKWSYEHEGAFDDKNNGTYIVSCQTKNYLHLPTTFTSGSMDIVMNGQVAVELGFKGDTHKWSTKAATKWSVTLSMTSQPGGSGISIDIKGNTRPKFEASHVHGDASLENLVDLNALGSLFNVDLAELSSELRRSFGGVWEHCYPGTHAYSLCNPIFNATGDILFELRKFVPRSQVPVPTARPRPSIIVRASGSSAATGPPAPRPQVKKSRSLLKRIGDGISGAVRGAGEAIGDVFDGDSDDEKSKGNHLEGMLKMERTKSAASLSPVTPAIERDLLKTPASEVGPRVTIANGGSHTESSTHLSTSHATYQISGNSTLDLVTPKIITQKVAENGHKVENGHAPVTAALKAAQNGHKPA